MFTRDTQVLNISREQPRDAQYYPLYNRGACNKPTVSCLEISEDVYQYAILGGKEAWYVESCRSDGLTSTTTSISLDGDGNATGFVTAGTDCCITVFATSKCKGDRDEAPVSASCNCPDPVVDPPVPCCTGCIKIFTVEDPYYPSGGDPYYESLASNEYWASYHTGDPTNISFGKFVDPGGIACDLEPGDTGIAIAECGECIIINTSRCCGCPPPDCTPEVEIDCSVVCGVLTWTATNATSVSIFDCDNNEFPQAGTSGTFNMTFPCCAYVLRAENACGEKSVVCCAEVFGQADWGVESSPGVCELNWGVTNACNAWVEVKCGDVVSVIELYPSDYCTTDTTDIPIDCECEYTFVVEGCTTERYPLGLPDGKCTGSGDCPCGNITAMRITLTGITGGDCECGQVMRDLVIPKDFESPDGSFCGGSVDIEDACEGDDDVDSYQWSVACGPSGIQVSILIDAFHDGQVIVTRVFPLGTLCSALGFIENGASPPAPTCDWSGSNIKVVPICS